MKQEISEENKKFSQGLSMKMTMHMNMENEGVLQHNGEFKGIKFGRVIRTPKRNGNWGKGVASFYFEGEKKEYKDANEFLNEFRNRVLTIAK